MFAVMRDMYGLEFVVNSISIFTSNLMLMITLSWREIYTHSFWFNEGEAPNTVLPHNRKGSCNVGEVEVANYMRTVVYV